MNGINGFASFASNYSIASNILKLGTIKLLCSALWRHLICKLFNLLTENPFTTTEIGSSVVLHLIP